MSKYSPEEIDQQLLSPTGQGPVGLSGASEENLGPDELLALIAARVSALWEQQPEYLMSMLYRLDVEESAILRVLHPNAPEMPYIGLAKLILERQQQRWATKRSVVVPKLGGEWGL